MKNYLTRKSKVYSGHSACAGCGGMNVVKYVDIALGDRKAVIIIPACCMTIVSGAYPQTFINRPVLHTSFPGAAATAVGVRLGIKKVYKEFGGDYLIVVIAGDGSTYDIGFGGISGMAERNRRVLYVCYNNEAYMNTGIQKSSATPKGARTTTTPGRKLDWKKNMPLLMADHNIPYVATCSIAHPEDAIDKVEKASDMDGTSYLEFLAVCPTGWKMPTGQIIQVARKAVQCGIYPLYEVEYGNWIINSPDPDKGPRFDKIREYLESQGRTKGMTEEQIRDYEEQIRASWEALKERYDHSKK